MKDVIKCKNQNDIRIQYKYYTQNSASTKFICDYEHLFYKYHTIKVW